MKTFTVPRREMETSKTVPKLSGIAFLAANTGAPRSSLWHWQLVASVLVFLADSLVPTETKERRTSRRSGMAQSEDLEPRMDANERREERNGRRRRVLPFAPLPLAGTVNNLTLRARSCHAEPR